MSENYQLGYGKSINYLSALSDKFQANACISSKRYTPYGDNDNDNDNIYSKL